jgi:hypothetical protein
MRGRHVPPIYVLQSVAFVSNFPFAAGIGFKPLGINTPSNTLLMDGVLRMHALPFSLFSSIPRLPFTLSTNIIPVCTIRFENVNQGFTVSENMAKRVRKLGVVYMYMYRADSPKVRTEQW